MTDAPLCPSCGKPASLLRRGNALTGGTENVAVWACLKPTCETWVECYPGTETPRGPLADVVARRAAEMWRRA